jgi:cobalamin biosynthesis protein CobD/CbiB
VKENTDGSINQKGAATEECDGTNLLYTETSCSDWNQRSRVGANVKVLKGILELIIRIGVTFVLFLFFLSRLSIFIILVVVLIVQLSRAALSIRQSLQQMEYSQDRI